MAILVNNIEDVNISSITKQQVYDVTIRDDHAQSVLNVYNLIFHNPDIPQNHVIKKIKDGNLKIYENGKWEIKKISDVSQRIINRVSALYKDRWHDSL